MPGRAALWWPGQSQQRPSAAAPCRWTSLAHPVSYGRKGAGPGGEGWAPGPYRSFGLNSSTRYDEDFNHEPCQRGEEKRGIEGKQREEKSYRRKKSDI